MARSRPHGLLGYQHQLLSSCCQAHNLRWVCPRRPPSKSNLCERAQQQRGLFMILGMSIGAFTILHVIITLIAIGSGLIVVGGLFASHKLPVTTALFLFTIHGFTPALGVGIVATAILLIALFALCKEHLVGAWRWIYAITAVVSLYLNVFVLVVQSFVKVSALNALAPTQTEPPFAVTQVAVLSIFILIALLAVIKFRPPQAQM